jgi:hypothetical protein
MTHCQALQWLLCFRKMHIGNLNVSASKNFEHVKFNTYVMYLEDLVLNAVYFARCEFIQ